MVAPAGSRSRELIPLPARRYVLRVQVDGTEYCYDATARLAQAQATVLASLRGYDKPTADGPVTFAIEGALRTAARLMIPLLVRVVAQVRRHPAAGLLLPELPRLPRHTDALEHLACWVTEAVFTALGTGVYVLEPDEEAGYVDSERDVIVLPVRRLQWDAGAPGIVDPTVDLEHADAAAREGVAYASD